jgi:hypothetical protein
MTRKAISTDAAPAALGPYSQAIVAGGLVFCSGTAGIDPATGVPGDGVEAQTELALRPPRCDPDRRRDIVAGPGQDHHLLHQCGGLRDH